MQKATTRKTSSKTTLTATLQRRATIKPTVPQVRFPSPQESIQRALNTHLTRPSNVQRQMATPALQAAHLYTSEHQQAQHQTASLQRQINELQTALPTNAIQSALQRQAQASTPTQQRPVTPGDWAVTMQREAQRIEGKTLNTQQHQQFMTLQRHVTQTLVQGFRQDRQPAPERYAQYGSHLATLQRHPTSGQVAHATMRLIPAGERPALQRAVDEAVQRQQEQDAQDAAALNLHALQRQLAEQEAQSQQSVMQRIQERRGSGNPLPESVQRHLEHGLNHDLSGVRIHDDAEADKMAKGVNAIAFTTGKDIFFQSGKFNPNTQTGLELLAHEVTHTVQQSKGQVGKGIDPDSGLEQEAREMGRKIAQTTPQHQTKPARFGNRQPGALTQARQPLQRTAALQSAQSIQRWGLGDLKKSFKKVKPFQEVARLVSKGVLLKKRIQKNIAGTIQKVSRQLDAVKTNTKDKLQAKPTKRLNATQNTKVKLPQYQPTTLKGRLTALAQRAKIAVETTRKKAEKAIAPHVKAIKAFNTKANKSILNVEAKAIQSILPKLQTAKAKMTSVKSAAQMGLQLLKAKAGSVKQSVTKAVQAAPGKLKAVLKATPGKLGKLAKTRPLLALGGAGASVAAGISAYKSIRKGGLNQLGQDIKNRVTKAVKWAISPEGIATMARIGVTATVGAAGAAATVLTGGLAGPAAVGATLAVMGATGVASGAAGRLIQNALLKKRDPKKYQQLKLTKGVFDKRAMLGDAALGMFLGPAGAAAGAVVRQGLANVGRYALAPSARLIAASGRGLATVAKTVVRGGRIVGKSGLSRQGLSRTADLTRRSAGKAGMRERLTASYKDFRQFNAKQWGRTRQEVTTSFRDGMGLGTKANEIATKLRTSGARSALVPQMSQRVQRLDFLQLKVLGQQLGLPKQTSLSALRSQLPKLLVQSNHQFVDQTIKTTAKKLAARQAARNWQQQLIGAPRRAGESRAARVLRGTGHFLTSGLRTNIGNVNEKDALLAKEVKEGGVVNALPFMAGAVTSEMAKMQAMSLRTKGELSRDPGSTQLLEAAVQAGGGTPDWYKEKGIASVLGFDALPKKGAALVGAGNIDAGGQFEDGEAEFDQ